MTTKYDKGGVMKPLTERAREYLSIEWKSVTPDWALGARELCEAVLEAKQIILLGEGVETKEEILSLNKGCIAWSEKYATEKEGENE